MSRIQFLLSAVVVVSLSTGLIGEDKKPQQIEGWGTVIDPDHDCHYEEKDGALTITIPATKHDLTYQDTGILLNTPRIVREVEGDFTMQVNVPKFALPGPTTEATGPFTFVSAGLLVWNDDKNFFRLERASVSPEPFAYVGGFIDGKTACHELQPLTDTDTVLRVQRKGNQLTFSARPANDDNWIGLLNQTFDSLPAKLHVGVESVNTVKKEFKATFQALEFTK